MRTFPQYDHASEPRALLNPLTIITTSEGNGMMTYSQLGPAASVRRRAFSEDFFAPQPTSTSELPDPEPLLRNLTNGVLETLAGVRDLDQLARWLTEEAYRALLTRVNLAIRARSARGVPAVRPVHSIVSVRHSSPADGVVEAVVVVAAPARTRAVAIRLEGMDRRWRATSLALL